MAFAGCSKDDEDSLVLSEDKVTLHQGEEYQIKASSSSEIKYIVKDEYHAEVSKTGVITALFVGETEIIVSNDKESKTFILTVAPKVNTYPEPNVYFGQSKEEILSKFGSPKVDSEGTIAYDNYSSKAPILMLQFDNNDELKSYMIAVKTIYSSELGSFLAERYLPVSLDDLIFVNGLSPETATMGIKAQLYNTSYWMVIYIPYSNNNISKSVTHTSINIPNQIENLLK